MGITMHPFLTEAKLNTPIIQDNLGYLNHHRLKGGALLQKQQIRKLAWPYNLQLLVQACALLHYAGIFLLPEYFSTELASILCNSNRWDTTFYNMILYTSTHKSTDNGRIWVGSANKMFWNQNNNNQHFKWGVPFLRTTHKSIIQSFMHIEKNQLCSNSKMQVDHSQFQILQHYELAREVNKKKWITWLLYSFFC